jgi:hypothetical protein
MTPPDTSAQQADWKTQPLPEQYVTLEIAHTFTPTEMQAILRGFIPEAMEDKWFIFYTDQTLFLHRSWTGYCMYEADFLEAAGQHKVSRLRVNRDPDQYAFTDDEYDKQLFVYLVNTLLLHKHSTPPPVPNHEQLSEEKRALSLWAILGHALLRSDDESPE